MTEPKPYGWCPACGKAYYLTAKGVLRMHRVGRLDAAYCPGSGMAPKGGAK